MFQMFKGVFNFIAQHINVDWLEQVCEGAVLNNFRGKLHVCMARENDNRGVGGETFYFLKHFGTVHVRHFNIKDDDVYGRVLKNFEASFTVISTNSNCSSFFKAQA